MPVWLRRNWPTLMEGTVFKFLCHSHGHYFKRALYSHWGFTRTNLWSVFILLLRHCQLVFDVFSTRVFCRFAVASPLRMHSGLEREGSGGRSMAVQSHANIMQLLSVGQKALLLSHSGTWHRNAQIINSRRRHRDTGSKVSRSHYPYMLHLCCPLADPVIPCWKPFPDYRTAPGKSKARPTEERWARAEASSPKTLSSFPSVWICGFRSRAQPGPAGSHWFVPVPNGWPSGGKPGLDLQREVVECVFIHD